MWVRSILLQRRPELEWRFIVFWRFSSTGFTILVTYACHSRCNLEQNVLLGVQHSFVHGRHCLADLRHRAVGASSYGSNLVGRRGRGKNKNNVDLSKEANIEPVSTFLWNIVCALTTPSLDYTHISTETVWRL